MIEFNRKSTRHWQNIFVHERSVWSKISILIKKREDVGINHFNNPKDFIEYSNDMHDVYKNIDEHNPDKENKTLIVFDDMIADLVHNKKLNSLVTELFVANRKLNISLVFITHSYFKVPKDVRLNTSYFFIAKISNKRELQQITMQNKMKLKEQDLKY